MKRAGKKTVEELDRIKVNVKDSHEYFKMNYVNFNEARRFIFESSLTQNDVSTLQNLDLPQLEFNIGEAYLSRIIGEFSKHEPTLSIYSIPNSSRPVDPNIIDVLERYIRSVMLDSNRFNLQVDVLRDCLSGGFSAIKVLTEYENPMSMHQIPAISKVYDPTLMVFDKMARQVHKGDGDFSAELFPMKEDDFKRKYGAKSFENANSDSIGDFRWSYTTNLGEKIILVADYYEKKIKNERIVQVAEMGDFPSQSMTEKQYEKFAERWASERIEQVPVVIGKARKTEIQTIDRFIVCANEVLEYNPTDLKYLPHIFVDGNSVLLRNDVEGSSYQCTRSFLHHAKDLQRLKNRAGIVVANELETMVQHKFMIAEEALSPRYTDPLTDVQKASVILFQAYSLENPDRANPIPTSAPRNPVPSEVISLFMACDQMMQNILGSYDGALGINGNNVSGAAIEAGASQSNPVAMPFLINYMSSLNRVGQILLDLIPKYMKGKRHIPIIDEKGKRTFIEINGKNGLNMSYDPHSLEIDIRAGVGFEVQRAKAFEAITTLMQINPKFQKFINSTPGGLDLLLDNIEIRGIDRIRSEVEKFTQQENQKEQQAMQMQMQQAQQAQQMQQAQLQMMQKNNPADIKREEMKLRAMKDGADIEIKKAKLDIDYMLAVAEIENQGVENDLRESEIIARNARTEVDLINKQTDHKHNRAMDLLSLHRESENINKQENEE